jgi:phosphoribosylanthranilate isomerase
VDAPRAGSGVEWDYGVMAGRGLSGPWLLAGGLTPANVASAIAAASPWGVDVSSGVETAPGEKDATLIREFLAAAKG